MTYERNHTTEIDPAQQYLPGFDSISLKLDALRQAQHWSENSLPAAVMAAAILQNFRSMYERTVLIDRRKLWDTTIALLSEDPPTRVTVQPSGLGVFSTAMTWEKQDARTLHEGIDTYRITASSVQEDDSRNKQISELKQAIKYCSGPKPSAIFAPELLGVRSVNHTPHRRKNFSESQLLSAVVRSQVEHIDTIEVAVSHNDMAGAEHALPPYRVSRTFLSLPPVTPEMIVEQVGMHFRSTPPDRLPPSEMEDWLKGHVRYMDNDVDRVMRELDALNHTLPELDHIPYSRPENI